MRVPTLNEAEWVVLHGDSAETPVWAVFDDDGDTLDLTNWWIRAQVRDTIDASVPRFTWTVGDGIDVGVATVDNRERRIETSTIMLYMRPAFYEYLSRRYEGVVDVEAASDATETPAERHTLVRFGFRVEPDITHSGGF